jgi:tetratricopeptide (TPR) repeat protein
MTAASHLETVTGHAEALLRAGRSRDARDSLMAALSQVERRNDRAALRQAVNLLGAANFELGELSTATEFFQRALELGQLDGDDLLVARATNNLGAIANVRGEREQALTMYALAIAAYQRLGEARGLAAAHHNMGITFRHIGLLDRADESECRAIDFAHEAGNARLLLLARIGRAEVSLLRGDAKFAAVAAARLASDFAKSGDPIQQANALRVVGAARLALREYDGALAVLADGLRLAVSHDAALIEAEVLRTRAEVFSWRGDHRAARDDAARAIGIFNHLNATADRDRLAHWLGAVDPLHPHKRRDSVLR